MLYKVWMQTFGAAQDRKLTPFNDGMLPLIKGFIFLKSITRVVAANLNAILMRSDMVYIYEVSGNNIVKTLSSAFSVYFWLGGVKWPYHIFIPCLFFF